MGRVGPAQPGIAGVDLLVDGLQLGGQAVHRQRLEHVADDVVLDGLLGILEIVEAAQKGNVHRRADLAHLPRQLDARDERHTDVGQQQVRLKPLDKLERIQPVAGIAHKVEAERLPGDHCADGLAQLVLIVSHDDGVDVFVSHTSFSFFRVRRHSQNWTRRLTFSYRAGFCPISCGSAAK